MPERNPTRNPMIVAGTTLVSGSPNTGQVMFTPGGSYAQSYYSGLSLTDRSVWVGAGRLDAVQYSNVSANRAASGIAWIFYDAAVALALPPLSGGSVNTSGSKVLGVMLPANVASGATIYGERREFGVAFTSGLCAQGLSGAPPITISFTPVISG